MNNRIVSFFSEGDKRSLKAKKNILISLGVRGLSILINLLLVPLILTYLDKERYGIWLTMSSFFSWFTFMGLGLGSGLRNYLAEALATNDFNLAKKYVSTTYIVTTTIFFVIGILFYFINSHLNWSQVLNARADMLEELQMLALIVFELFFCTFILKLISIILFSAQRPALANSIVPISNLISLVIIWILLKTTEGNLIYLGTVLNGSTVLIYLTFSIVLFGKKYKQIRPSINFFEFKHVKRLFNLGIQFFIIQVSGLILYQTSNIMITQFFGPSQVTIYNIAYKYLSLAYMLFIIILSPFWSAFTEAWVKSDYVWIKRAIRKLEVIWVIMVILLSLLVILSEKLYLFWVGPSVNVPFSLTLVISVYIIFLMSSSLYSAFLNGISIMRVQLIYSVLGSLLFVILTLSLITVFELGIESVPISLGFVSIIGTIVVKIQTIKILNNKSFGIWAK